MTQKKGKLIPKGCQNRSQNDAKNHQKSMPKLVENQNQENSPTLWSGVLDHLETGGGILPPTAPPATGRIAGARSKHRPV